MTVIRRLALKITVAAVAVSIVAATLSGQTPIPVPGQRGQGARGAQGGQRGAQQPVAPVHRLSPDRERNGSQWPGTILRDVHG